MLKIFDKGVDKGIKTTVYLFGMYTGFRIALTGIYLADKAASFIFKRKK